MGSGSGTIGEANLFCMIKITGGKEEPENPYVVNAPDVVKAGGLEALKILGEPKEIVFEIKKRLFAA